MSLYQRYKMKNNVQFTRLVGVNHATFSVILEKLKIQIDSFKAENRVRQRGRKSSLLIEDQLLLTMIYLRQYHTFLQLADMFSISESYAQKRYTFISKMLMKALDIPNDKALTSDNLTLVIDVTEQQIERPIKKQADYYSGKKSDTR